MREFGPGAILAIGITIVLGSAATAQSQPDSATGSVMHPRRSFFTSDQSRSDVSAHIGKMFKQLDLDHDGFITRAEIASAQEQFAARTSKSAPKRAEHMFDRMDANHDGRVTLAEAGAVRSARLAARGKAAKASHVPASLFKLADENKDGVVTRAEFDTAIDSGKIKPRHSTMRGSAIALLFDRGDTNGDGRLSLEEAQSAAQQCFDAADANRDGVLTPDERRQASKAERAKRRAAG